MFIQFLPLKSVRDPVGGLNLGYFVEALQCFAMLSRALPFLGV
jgi:hypothetical protein